jgi:hypothetical protein
MACNLVKMNIEGEALHAVPYGGVSEAELAVLRNNKEALDQEEAAGLIEAVIRSHEPDNLHYVTRLLKAGKDPRRILDVMQIACAQVVMETNGPNNFSMPHHCYEYCNTLAWFYDNFDHPRRLRLIYLLASFLNHVAWHQKGIGDSDAVSIKPPSGADKLTAGQLLDHVDSAVCALNGPESLAWTRAYLDNVGDRAPLVERIALAATKLGNDPHNQEIAQCMLMDYGTNRHPERDNLLLAAAYHTAMHRKYGDPLEPAKRFGDAMGVALH